MEIFDPISEEASIHCCGSALVSFNPDPDPAFLANADSDADPDPSFDDLNFKNTTGKNTIYFFIKNYNLLYLASIKDLQASEATGEAFSP
jgi:hypothetical protein